MKKKIKTNVQCTTQRPLKTDKNTRRNECRLKITCDGIKMYINVSLLYKDIVPN